MLTVNLEDVQTIGSVGVLDSVALVFVNPPPALLEETDKKNSITTPQISERRLVTRSRGQD